MIAFLMVDSMKYKLIIQFFGGRGASSGISEKGNKYGTQYTTLKEVGNVKFVKPRFKNAESLLETMTKGRVYGLIKSNNELSQIVYFDNDNKRVKTIDLLHKHNSKTPHTHVGYYHDENGTRGLTPKEK